MVGVNTSGEPLRSLIRLPVVKLRCCPVRMRLRRASLGSNAAYASAVTEKPFQAPMLKLL